MFDEGHQLFDAADDAFSLHLSGRETAELRRWLRGAEDGGRAAPPRLAASAPRTARATTAPSAEALAEALALRPQPAGAGLARPRRRRPRLLGPAESFLALARQQVYARSRDGERRLQLEAAVQPPIPGLLDAAAGSGRRLGQLLTAAARAGCARSQRRLDDEAARLDTTHAAAHRGPVPQHPPPRAPSRSTAGGRCCARSRRSAPPEFVDWLAVERIDGREIDVGLYRHWVDPMRPVRRRWCCAGAWRADHLGDPARRQRRRRCRLGARRRTAPAPATSPAPRCSRRCLAVRLRRAQTRVLVVTDVDRDDVGQVAAAYRELFLAAGGGALGLFTAISRLRAVHEAIARPLERGGLDAVGAARRRARRRHPDRHLPRRGGRLPARHRRGARRHRRARPLAAADRLRPGAVAAANACCTGRAARLSAAAPTTRC